MCVGSYKYKGLIIYKNMSEKFNTPYFSVFNPKNEKHTHSNTSKESKNIVDCYWKIHNGAYAKLNYSRSIRNRAMRLDGCYVKMI